MKLAYQLEHTRKLSNCVNFNCLRWYHLIFAYIFTRHGWNPWKSVEHAGTYWNMHPTGTGSNGYICHQQPRLSNGVRLCYFEISQGDIIIRIAHVLGRPSRRVCNSQGVHGALGPYVLTERLYISDWYTIFTSYLLYLCIYIVHIYLTSWIIWINIDGWWSRENQSFDHDDHWTQCERERQCKLCKVVSKVKLRPKPHPFRTKYLFF